MFLSEKLIEKGLLSLSHSLSRSPLPAGLGAFLSLLFLSFAAFAFHSPMQFLSLFEFLGRTNLSKQKLW